MKYASAEHADTAVWHSEAAITSSGGVIEAKISGEISSERFESYQQIVASLATT